MNETPFVFVTAPLKDPYLQRETRHARMALLISLLVHAALLWLFQPKLFSMGLPKVAPSPIEVTLALPQKAQSAPAPAVQEIAPTPPEKPVEPIKKPSAPTPKKHPPAPKKPPPQPPIKTVEDSALPIPKPAESPPPTAQQDAPLPGEDMQAYIKRQQAARLAKQGEAKQDAEEVVVASNEPSAGDRRDAAIKKNLDFSGTNGIFEIRHLGLHEAQFSFKGWKNNVNTARLEIIDVVVPDGADARREVIKKMIEIIRREYDGDFNWESRRLGRVLVLSARPQDNQALEDFMMNEFFGSGTRTR